MKKFFLSVLAFAAMAPVVAKAADFSAGADIVSSYVWRGNYQGQGAAIQPGMGAEFGNFSVGAWGSSTLGSNGTKELDFTAGYQLGNLYIGFTDYWWNGEGSPYFENNTHFGELNLAYTISENFPLSIAANTFLYGPDEKANGDQAFSTYINVSYPFSCGDFDFNAGIGYITNTKDNSAYAANATKDSGISDISLRASYEIQVTDKFSLPIFSDVIFSPVYDNAYFVVGVSFGL